MAGYQFSAVVGTTFAFNTLTDTLFFDSGDNAGSLVFKTLAEGLQVSIGARSTILSGVTFGALRQVNFSFPNGGIATFDSSNSDARPGSNVSDYLPLNAGGNDTVQGFGGDDWFFAGSSFTPADRVDGGAGYDTLQISGSATYTLLATSLVGVERIQIDSGNTRIDLAANTASSATLGPGGFFTIDARGISGSWLRVEGGAETATPLLLLSAAGQDTLIGGGGHDSLSSDAGYDSLSGGGGNDTLRGGQGADTLRGGDGDDLFDLSEATVGVSAPALSDMIVDFQGAGAPGGDRIALPSGQSYGAPLRFSLDPMPFSFTGYTSQTPQLPAYMIADGFADVVWMTANDPNYRFLLWIDGNDNGRFDATDLLLRINVAAGASAARLSVDDFVVDFAGYTGTAGPDCLIGRGEQDDVFYGLGGNDTLVGNAGSDVIDGGAGDDSLSGGTFYDELYGSGGNDTLDGGDGPDVLYAGDPNNPTVETETTRNLLMGGAGDDEIYGGYGADTLLGGDGQDLLWADSGADSLHGGDGDDRLHAGMGGDTLAGGAGRDLFIFDLTWGLSPSTPFVTGAVMDLSLIEGEYIAIGAADGQLEGPDGPGVVNFGGTLASRDIGNRPPIGMVLPSTGLNDRAYTFWWVPATAGGQPSGGWLLGDLDRDGRLNAPDFMLRIYSQVAEPSLLMGDALLQPRIGTAGNDALYAYALGSFMVGGDGADTLVGSPGHDVLLGGAGNDSLISGDSADRVDGGPGADTMQGGNGSTLFYVDDPGDRIIEVPGNGMDTVIASVSHYLAANVEVLVLAESAGDLFAVGTSADDQLFGNEGSNLLIAHAGNDTADGGAGRDLIFGLDGNDRLLGAAGVDYLVGGNGNDWVDGGADADEMYGEAGNDTLYGGPDFATDILLGGSGNDSLDGGPAWDLMYGGAGDDTYRVSQQVDWVFEFPNEGIDLVIADSPNGYYLYDNLENIILLGNTPFGVGNALANRLTGSSAHNWLLGGGGNDTLDGMGGGDVLFGQSGADLFMIRAGPGQDVIGDFTPGVDRLNLIGSGLTTHAQVMARFGQVGADALLTLSGTQQVIFQGLQIGTLTSGDFIFSP